MTPADPALLATLEHMSMLIGLCAVWLSTLCLIQLLRLWRNK